jgi:hypothetical protein
MAVKTKVSANAGSGAAPTTETASAAPNNSFFKYVTNWFSNFEGSDR